MSLIDRFKAAVVRRFSISDPDAPVHGPRSDAGEVVTDASVLGLSAVWGCTNLISGTISTLPATVYRKNSKGRAEATDHPLHRLLSESPNYDQTAVDFWAYISMSLDLWGNAYAAIERDSLGRVAGLLPVNPAIIVVKRLASGAIEYQWTHEGRAFKRLDSEMLHVRGFGGDPLGGMSTLQFGRNAFGLARAVDRAAGATFANGMRPSGALTFDNFLSAEHREIAEKKLTEKFVGAVNAGRPLILEGGAKWQPLTLNPEDAQMLESRKFGVEEICRFFGVPPHMIGHTEKSTSWGTGIEQQVIGFQKFTLRPRLKRIEQAVKKQLLTPAERARGLYVEFNLEGLLRGDSASRSAFYQSGLTNGWMTINEVRALENLEPVEGGEVPRMQMQNVPITQADQITEAGE